MSTPARFSDGQYKNWLKCSHSLIIMKEALHDYIDDEVNKLHRDIMLKVSSIPCGSSTGNQCGSCSWKGIKLTGGNPRAWSINCKNSICDKWLHAILAVHDDPHNPNINWKNADISKWPTNCYHVAKIFMPKGQDKTTNMPHDLDAPAILSLMKYCNWFRKDLPNTQILSDLIDIRNTVLHSGDLRVADSDKDNWIDLMIQLLNDLNIPGDSQAELQMFKREDVDIDFRATEIRVFQRMVIDLESELTTLKEDMLSVQDFQSELSKEMTRLKDNTETATKVDTVEADIKEIRKSLHELRNISDKMVSFLDKNPDILDIKVTETIRNVSRDVEDLLRVKKEQAERLSALEMKVESIQEETKKQFEGVGRGLDTIKEQLALQNSEYPGKKRPETDSLKQLKNQTEDKLDTLKRLQYIPTKQAEKAKELLEGKGSIVIRGNPGEGKTTMALHLIDNEMYRYRRVVLHFPQDWKTVDTDWVDIVILDDMLGQFDLDFGHLEEWMVYLPDIQEHIDAGKLRVIITTRDDVLSKAFYKLGSLKLFSDDLSVRLSSKELRDSEKISILNRQLQRHEKNMKEDEKETCIANFCGLIGFPQCCSIFAGDSKLFDGGPQFFSSPNKFFVANIRVLEDTRFLSLAFLFCNSNIFEENLSPESMPECSKNILMDLASHLHISKQKSSITLLRDAYESFLDLYVVRFMSYNSVTRCHKPCFRFTHATVSEAVGQILGDRCPEVVVKYGNSEYLYQRTYTAKAKDNTNKNVFIPVSLYGLLAERIVQDVKKGLIRSVVKHSALKLHDFLMTLKCELQKSKMIKEFFTAQSFSWDLKEETFMQCIFQSDEDVARLVYSDLLELLACTHNNNTSDCWQCEEKQELLELALYYHQFEIADKLITMKASYTHVSLHNAATHADFGRVQSILETLKSNKNFSPNCNAAKDALCRAYLSGIQRLIELLLNEGVVLDATHVTIVVKHADLNVLMKVVEHLKSHNKWKPRVEIDMDIAYIKGKFDMADYLLKEKVKVSLDTLAVVSKKGSQLAVARVIQNLKDSDNWDPKCNDASKILQTACSKGKYDVCDLLVQEGVSITMKKFHDIFMERQVSLETVKKAIQYLKETDNWDPKCDDASKTLEYAYKKKRYDLCDLLIQEQISLTLKNLPGVMERTSSECIKKAIQHLKDTDSWDPKCNDASTILEKAYIHQKHDVCDQLVQEGVLLTMENLPGVVTILYLETIKNILQHLKETDNWCPKSDDAYKALNKAYWGQKFDVCDLLVQEGVSPTMENFLIVINHYEVSLQTLKNAMQHLKVTGNWNPRYVAASIAFKPAYSTHNCDMWDMLFHEGVSPTMENLVAVMSRFDVSLKFVKNTIQYLKDTSNWDPKSDYVYKALERAHAFDSDKMCDILDLLVQEGVSLTMKILPVVTNRFHKASLELVKKAIQHLKDSHTWNSECNDAIKALRNAYDDCSYDVSDLLVQEGVTPTMENFVAVMTRYQVSLKIVKKIVQHLKDKKKWNSKCDDASNALADAYSKERYYVCNLLVQEGVSLTMKHLPDITEYYAVSLESVKKVIQHLKDTHNWNPKCDYASKALENAHDGISHQKNDVCYMLFQEGVSTRMRIFPSLINTFGISLEHVKKAIQVLKDTHNWDSKCNHASKALSNAYSHQKYDVCDLLVQEGVSLKMENLNDIQEGNCVSIETIKKTIQHLKDTDKWDPKCNDASRALENAYIGEEYDVCDLLVQEGVTPTMKQLPHVIGYNYFAYTMKVSLKTVKKVIQHLKYTHNWDPMCDDAYKTLENAYIHNKHVVCDLLIQEGVSLTMKNFPDITKKYYDSVYTFGKTSLESVMKAIQHMKDTQNWDPKCDDASKALEIAYGDQSYDMCDLLIQEGVSLTMKNFPGIIKKHYNSLESVTKAIQHMKDTQNSDLKCDDASKALENANGDQSYDVYDLLIQEEVSLAMKNFPGIIKKHYHSLESVTKAIQHMKDTQNWDPKCDDAYKALENAYGDQSYDVCDLLIQEGVSLTMKNFPGIIKKHYHSLQSVTKAIQHMKDTHNWDPKCDDASKALENAYIYNNYVVCELLNQEGVIITMKNFPGIIKKMPMTIIVMRIMMFVIDWFRRKYF